MKIITNTAESVDGKISLRKDELFLMGSPEDRRRMSEVRASADAVLVGGNSFRNLPIPMLPRPEHRLRDLSEAPLLNVVVSRRMDFVLSERFLGEKAVRPLFITSNRGAVEDFPTEVAFLNPVTPTGIIAELEKRGVKTLLLEAGGDLIAQFLAADLVDEMYVTLCPKLIGGKEAPSLVGGDGFGKDHIRNAKLLDARVRGDEIFLHYEVLR